MIPLSDIKLSLKVAVGLKVRLIIIKGDVFYFYCTSMFGSHVRKRKENLFLLHFCKTKFYQDLKGMEFNFIGLNVKCQVCPSVTTKNLDERFWGCKREDEKR